MNWALFFLVATPFVLWYLADARARSRNLRGGK